jgi:hypothetical protein
MLPVLFYLEYDNVPLVEELEVNRQYIITSLRAINYRKKDRWLLKFNNEETIYRSNSMLDSLISTIENPTINLIGKYKVIPTGMYRKNMIVVLVSL